MRFINEKMKRVGLNLGYGIVFYIDGVEFA